MKKNGFTLVELLAVISILAVIVLLSTYGINVARSTLNEKMWDKKVELIENAAEKWASDNKTLFPADNTCKTVTIEVLINKRYLTASDKDSSGENVIINNKTGEKVDYNSKAEVCLKSNSFYAKYPK